MLEQIRAKPLKEHLSLYERLYLRLFYLRRALFYDLPENQVGWRSRQNQELRFKELSGIGDLKGSSVLDLGCGLGCFYGYLKASGWEGEYCGIDILGPMVRKAKRRYPGVDFEKRDVLRDPPGRKWDYVVINGVFNHKIRDNWSWIEAMAKAALDLSGEGVAFNLLDRGTGWMDQELFYADPRELEEKVRVWSPRGYKIKRTSLPEDLTVYMYSREAV